MGVNFRNAEGYYDPVPGMAMANMERESNKYRPLVYICSPYSGDTKGNTEKAKRYCRFAVDQGVVPLAPHLLLPLFMSEQTERDLAMFMDMVFLGRCVQIWVFGSEITEGMQAEIDRATYKNMTIRYFTDDLQEDA